MAVISREDVVETGTQAKAPSSVARWCDCVVMLTWSDWHKEPRSNRYHYAVRFARHVPVIFVQPDEAGDSFSFEATEVSNVEILHVSPDYGSRQSELLNRALLSRGLIKPLLWIYNSHFVHFIHQRYAALRVFHATEDYYSPDLEKFGDHTALRKEISAILSNVDLVVAVSDGVAWSFRERGGYAGPLLMIGNGCDAKFWEPSREELARMTRTDRKPIILYQGAINYRIDIGLLEQIAAAFPDGELWICGKDDDAPMAEWESLRSRPNVRYWGLLPPRELRDISLKATVGIIPFLKMESMQISFPLKAFEYVACGLPVVSVPIAALEPYGELFQFAEESRDFIKAIEACQASRFDSMAIAKRLKAAALRGYDHNFTALSEWIDDFFATSRPKTKRFNVLIIYDDGSTHVITLREHLESFALFSRNDISFSVVTLDGFRNAAPGTAGCFGLYDAVVIHYSVRLSVEAHLSPGCADALQGYGGLKIAFVQDDYETTETTRTWIERLGVHAVFTIVPKAYIEAVYPKSRFAHVEFHETLTGFVPLRPKPPEQLKPIAERKWVIGYRGRDLPYWYGNLGREKLIIGQRMRQICDERGITVDIESQTDRRIYGSGWYDFLENSKATLATESGANVFDDYGDIRRDVEKALAAEPTLSYEEIFARYLAEHEGRIVVNQISPKVFESIAYKTALVMFEGAYSGVVEPWKHYIPLKKDFSNIDDVLSKLADDEYLQSMAERAYSHVVESDRYSYRQFIEAFDDFLAETLRWSNNYQLVYGLVGTRNRVTPKLTPEQALEVDLGRGMVTRAPLEIVAPLKVQLPLSVLRGTWRSVFSGVGSEVEAPASSAQMIVQAVGIENLSGRALLKEAARRVKSRVARKLAGWPLIFAACRGVYRQLLVPLYRRLR